MVMHAHADAVKAQAARRPLRVLTSPDCSDDRVRQSPQRVLPIALRGDGSAVSGCPGSQLSSAQLMNVQQHCLLAALTT